VGEDFNAEMCEEGLVQVVEDGILSVNLERLGFGVRSIS
jgi:hypothetical protein